MIKYLTEVMSPCGNIYIINSTSCICHQILVFPYSRIKMLPLSSRSSDSLVLIVNSKKESILESIVTQNVKSKKTFKEGNFLN